MAVDMIGIIAALEENLQEIPKLTEKLHQINIDIASLKTTFRRTYGIRVNDLKTNTPYNLVKYIVDGSLTKEIGEIEKLEADKMYLFNLLENKRQEQMILSSMMKVESELIK